MDPATILTLITVGKIALGVLLLGIVITSMYRFKGLALSIMGVLLILNVICLAVIAHLTS